MSNRKRYEISMKIKFKQVATHHHDTAIDDDWKAENGRNK